MTNQTFYIGGMTCSAGELQVSYTSPCRSDDIRKAVEDAGYQLLDQADRDRSGIWILVILCSLLIIARHWGWTSFFRAFPTVSEEQVGYAALFLIGLMTSVHCIAMCGGINLSQSVSGTCARPLCRSLLYNFGRLISYTFIGGILGLIGSAAAVILQLRGIIGLAAGLVMVLMGVNMLGHFGILQKLSPKLPAPLARVLASISKHGPLAVGLVNGLMPCGPLQAMQIYAIASGSWLTGALSMFFFCLGTIPLVLLFGAAASILRVNWRKRMLQFSAAALVLFGFFMVQNNLALAGIALPCGTSGSSTSEVVSATVDGDTQYLTTYLHVNGYDDIQVTAGIPLVWTIIAEDGSLNGCNNELILPAFDRQVQLSEGENLITLTPLEPGTYSYSCWMGMLRNTITVQEAQE